MNISKVGLDLIYDFEGRLKLLPDGRYKAYRCPAGVWTIYAGCTDGVHAGMIVTETEGEAMFRKEIAKFESGVMRLVTREMTQPQFDALVSFAYNCGLGALEKSSLLRYFNAGDIDRAAKAFALWNKGGGRVLRGLVRRRAAEAALFLSSGVADEPEMPQAVEPSPEKPSRPTVAIGTGVVGAGGAITISEVGQSVQVAKDAKALVPAAASYVWPALILAAGLIGAGLLMRRRNG